MNAERGEQPERFAELERTVERQGIELDRHRALLEGEGNGSLADMRTWYLRDWAALTQLLELLRPKFTQTRRMVGVVAIAAIVQTFAILALFCWVLFVGAPAIGKLAALAGALTR